MSCKAKNFVLLLFNIVCIKLGMCLGCVCGPSKREMKGSKLGLWLECAASDSRDAFVFMNLDGFTSLCKGTEAIHPQGKWLRLRELERGLS